MKSQWDCFLQNLGEWQGSFTQLSPQGEVLSDTPSFLSLEGLDNDQKVRLTLRRDGKPEVVLEYETIGGGLKFCENDPFSQNLSPPPIVSYSIWGRVGFAAWRSSSSLGAVV